MVRPVVLPRRLCGAPVDRVRTASASSRSTTIEHRTVAVLGARYGDLAIEESLLAPLGVTLRAGTGRSAEDIVDVAGDADVILAGAAPRFPAEVLERLNCRGIVRYGVGTDSIDVRAAAERGIAVVNVPDYGTEAVAVHATTLVLAATRRLVEADRLVRAGRWDQRELRPLHLPSSLCAGVIGLGRIGSRTAALLAGLGFEVVAHDAYASLDPPRDDIEETSFEDVLRRADVLTLHVPGTERGYLLGPQEFAHLKLGSALVNTARGSLVSTTALVEGLLAERPRIAALDVLEQEPPDLSAFEPVADRLILSPHMAWFTEETQEDLRRKAAEEARRLLEGQPPGNPVTLA